MINCKIYALLVPGLVLLLLVFLIGWFITTGPGELAKPTISLSREITHLGKRGQLSLTLKDEGRGLRSCLIKISQYDRDIVIYSGNENGVTLKNINLDIEPALYKLHNGPAVLTITAVDNSLWKNVASLSRRIEIDTEPPYIKLHSHQNYIRPGGTCVIAYEVSEEPKNTTVKVNDNPFTSFSISGKEKRLFLSYIPIPLNTEGLKITITVQDQADNESSMSVPYRILGRKFRSDRMVLSDDFLVKKIPEFQNIYPSLKNQSALNIFNYINTTLREENNQFIREICTFSATEKMWEGPFLRLKNSSTMADFGERRVYVYAGKIIGESTHLGVDLASTANAPVEAANSGMVIFTGFLGIYGNTVIIDHGMSLFSLYAHLSTVEVQKGQTVRKGEFIGKTGTTGLAGGDHLHYSQLIMGHFVDPKEWWDPHWIEDNVNRKTNF